MAYDRIENDLLEKLVAVYPQTFFLNQADRRPLKIGVHHDLTLDTARHGLSRDELRKALVWYCSSPGYAAATVLNAPRIGLDGEIAGLVTVEAVSAAIKAARSERRGGNAGKKVVAAAVAPEQQTVKPAPEAVPETESKRLSSLSDLRTAAKARRATA